MIKYFCLHYRDSSFPGNTLDCCLQKTAVTTYFIALCSLIHIPLRVSFCLLSMHNRIFLLCTEINMYCLFFVIFIMPSAKHNSYLMHFIWMLASLWAVERRMLTLESNGNIILLYSNIFSWLFFTPWQHEIVNSWGKSHHSHHAGVHVPYKERIKMFVSSVKSQWCE